MRAPPSSLRTPRACGGQPTPLDYVLTPSTGGLVIVTTSSEVALLHTLQFSAILPELPDDLDRQLARVRIEQHALRERHLLFVGELFANTGVR
jgi:hypothetical protein